VKEKWGEMERMRETIKEIELELEGGEAGMEKRLVE